MNFIIDYVTQPCYNYVLAHEGRLPETILTAERDVASTAARNPRTQDARGRGQAGIAWRRGAFAPEPAHAGDGSDPGPTTPRWSKFRISVDPCGVPG